MAKEYETDEIIIDEEANLDNPNIIKQVTVEEWEDCVMHHSHTGMVSSSSVTSVLSLISAALADLGADTTEIDEAIAALESSDEEESEDGEEADGEETEGEAEGTETEGETEEGTESESEGE